MATTVLPVEPWNEVRWRALAEGLDRLTHALLLAGPSGLGKETLALALARLAVCERPRGIEGACGSCRACELNRAGTHPDLHFITSEHRLAAMPAEGTLAALGARYATPESRDRKPRRVIAVDQVRAAIAAAATNAHMGPRKVFLFSPAEAMNANAANALLKLLEEPPGETLLLLVSHDPGRLPATIRSRCVRVEFRALEEPGSQHWLEEQGGVDPPAARRALALAGHRPGVALQWLASGFLARRSGLFDGLDELAEGKVDALGLASRWQDLEPALLLGWLHGVLADLARIAIAGISSQDPAALLRNPDQAARLQVLSERVDWQELFTLQEVVATRRSWLGGQADETLIVEEVLVALQELIHRQPQQRTMP